MYIKEIKIDGFKSFADRINLELNKTFTGIVGPNGSGKSNIVDAIKWVLGEQSIKTLRGTTGMSDVIFNGSKSRDAKNAASVQLVFDNSDKTLKIDYEEVGIKRIVYRSGENEYYLNGERCRLKDITDLFLDSFNTKDGINIIAQGKVNELLSSRPEDRRVILEEAAGVLKYKRRKEESLRKLEKTHDNLDRINMIIRELEGQVIPLEKEAEKARKYKEVKNNLTSVDVALIVSDITSNFTELEEAKKKVNTLKESLSFKSTESSKSEAEIERLKLKQVKLEEEESKKRALLITITEEVNELTSKKDLLLERTKYDKRSDEVKNNLVRIKEEELKLKNEIDSLKRAIEIKREEESKLESELKKLESEDNILNTRLDVLKSEWNEKVKEEVNYKNKFEVLTNNINNNELLPFSVKSVINNRELSGIHNIVANLIETDAKYQMCMSVALGSGANNIVVENEKAAKDAIMFLKERKLGRATFLPINVMKPKSIEPSILDKIKEEAGFVGVASNLVRYDKMYHPVIMNMLGNVIVANDIDSATNISKLVWQRYRVVTLSGDVINVGGSMTGGFLREKSNVISEKYELDRIGVLLENIEERKKAIVKEEEELEFSKNAIKDSIYKKNIELVNLKEFLWNKESILKEDEVEHAKLKQEINDLSLNSEAKIDAKVKQIMDECYKKENKKNELNDALNNIAKNIKDIKETIFEKEQIIKKSNSIERETLEEVNKLEVLIAKSNMTLDNLLLKLNEEYSLTYEHAKEVYRLEIPVEEARAQVSDAKKELKLIGNVNLNSIEEFDRVNKRYTFLKTQREDLISSENNIFEVIKNMDDIMIEKFATTFNKVNKEFCKVFNTLFGGGEAHLKLTDPSNVLETGIEIIAYPPGKKPAAISLLSGGEKTLTAISLLFAIMNLKDLPFVVLDEVESALDEANVDRFGSYLSNYKGKTQLLIITHKKKTMEYVDLLYGITMEESGVSKLVSVKLEGAK